MPRAFPTGTADEVPLILNQDAEQRPESGQSEIAASYLHALDSGTFAGLTLKNREFCESSDPLDAFDGLSQQLE